MYSSWAARIKTCMVAKGWQTRRCANAYSREVPRGVDPAGRW